MIKRLYTQKDVQGFAGILPAKQLEMIRIHRIKIKRIGDSILYDVGALNKLMLVSGFILIEKDQIMKWSHKKDRAEFIRDGYKIITE